MFRIRALLNGIQIQSIEYQDLNDGLAKMALMHPDCFLEHVDMIKEKADRDAQDLIARENKKLMGVL